MVFIKYIKNITFDRENLLFAAGESITGSLILMAAGGAQIYDLQLLLTGTVSQFSQIHFPVYLLKEYRIRNFSPEAAHAIHYFQQANESCTNLPPRETLTLPFEIKIPKTLPSSFDRGSDGHISYSLCLVGKSFSNSLCPYESFCYDKEIKIIGLVNPRKPGFCQPVSRTVKHQSPKQNGGDASMKVNLETACCTPGDVFTFNVQVENNLRLPLSSIKMKFITKIFQNVELSRHAFIPTSGNASGPSKRSVLGMTFTQEGPSIPPGPGRKINWDGSFTVAHVVPSGLGAEKCRSFDVQYFLQFELKNFVNLKINVPIHIGTSPELFSGDENEMEILSAYEKNIGGDQPPSKSGMSSRAMSMLSISSGWVSTLDLCSELDDDSSSRRGSVFGGSSSSGRRSAPPPYRSQHLPAPTPPPSYNEACGGDLEDIDETK